MKNQELERLGQRVFQVHEGESNASAAELATDISVAAREGRKSHDVSEQKRAFYAVASRVATLEFNADRESWWDAQVACGFSEEEMFGHRVAYYAQFLPDKPEDLTTKAIMLNMDVTGKRYTYQVEDYVSFFQDDCYAAPDFDQVDQINAMVRQDIMKTRAMAEYVKETKTAEPDMDLVRSLTQKADPAIANQFSGTRSYGDTTELDVYLPLYKRMYAVRGVLDPSEYKGLDFDRYCQHMDTNLYYCSQSVYDMLDPDEVPFGSKRDMNEACDSILESLKSNKAAGFSADAAQDLLRDILCVKLMFERGGDDDYVPNADRLEALVEPIAERVNVAYADCFQEKMDYLSRASELGKGEILSRNIRHDAAHAVEDGFDHLIRQVDEMIEVLPGVLDSEEFLTTTNTAPRSGGGSGSGGGNGGGFDIDYGSAADKEVEQEDVKTDEYSSVLDQQDEEESEQEESQESEESNTENPSEQDDTTESEEQEDEKSDSPADDMEEKLSEEEILKRRAEREKNLDSSLNMKKGKSTKDPKSGDRGDE